MASSEIARGRRRSKRLTEEMAKAIRKVEGYHRGPMLIRNGLMSSGFAR